MKRSVLLSALFLLSAIFLPLSAAADDTYVATMSGIDCNACKKTIAKSIGKIEGVKTIRIVENKNGTHRMTVITDGSNSISRTDAQKSIKDAEHYKIVSWTKTN